MKAFKKKRTKLPKPEVITRFLNRYAPPPYCRHYNHLLNNNRSVIPLAIREVCLAMPDPNKRDNVCYFPDFRSFTLNAKQNRSLPAAKFIEMFRGMLPDEELDKLIHDLTAFRLEFYTAADDWVRVYSDDNVHSCMSQTDIVACYAHQENKLAICALYAPGTNTVIARTIVNTELKWYVRLFGDALLVKKLNDLGYRRLQDVPPEFIMYAQAARNLNRFRKDYDPLIFPYFDFSCQNTHPINSTYDPNTGRIEVIINRGHT